MANEKYEYTRFQLNLRKDKPYDKRMIDFININGGVDFIKGVISGLMNGAVFPTAPAAPIEQKEMVQEEKIIEVDAELNKDDFFGGF